MAITSPVCESRFVSINHFTPEDSVSCYDSDVETAEPFYKDLNIFTSINKSSKQLRSILSELQTFTAERIYESIGPNLSETHLEFNEDRIKGDISFFVRNGICNTERIGLILDKAYEKKNRPYTVYLIAQSFMLLNRIDYVKPDESADFLIKVMEISGNDPMHEERVFMFAPQLAYAGIVSREELTKWIPFIKRRLSRRIDAIEITHAALREGTRDVDKVDAIIDSAIRASGGTSDGNVGGLAAALIKAGYKEPSQIFVRIRKIAERTYNTRRREDLYESVGRFINYLNKHGIYQEALADQFIEFVLDEAGDYADLVFDYAHVVLDHYLDRDIPLNEAYILSLWPSIAGSLFYDLERHNKDIDCDAPYYNRLTDFWFVKENVPRKDFLSYRRLIVNLRRSDYEYEDVLDLIDKFDLVEGNKNPYIILANLFIMIEHLKLFGLPKKLLKGMIDETILFNQHVGYSYLFKRILTEYPAFESRVELINELGPRGFLQFIRFLKNSKKSAEDKPARELLDLCRRIKDEKDITFWGRHSYVVFDHLLHAPPGKIALIITPDDADWNGANFNIYKLEEALIAAGWTLLVIEAGRDKKIYKRLESLEDKKICRGDFFGHGNAFRLRLSQLAGDYDEEYYEKHIDIFDRNWKVLTSKFCPGTLDEPTEIYLHTCSAGDKNEPNLARAMFGFLKGGVTYLRVAAPPVDASSKAEYDGNKEVKVIFMSDGRVIDATEYKSW